jgi:pyrimidine-nucleoside phosphorylase
MPEYTFLDLVNAKRLGHAHTGDEIDFIVKSVMNGSVDDCVVTAWLMAACCNGMTVEETTALTAGMAHSGTVLDFKNETRPVVDKHSTGGVGDKTTLVLVPLLAACGAMVPKLSGRALEHTGGTLDKLEAIPDFTSELSMDRFVAQVREIGAAIASPTADLAPADAKLYSLRNRTGTVDSVHIGTGSVMCKKIAGGASFILLDVKCGNGAFMQTKKRAREIATMMIAVGRALERKTKAVITNMDQPLGNAVGNALEVAEAIEVLSGGGPADLKELCLVLGALTLISTNLARGEHDARQKLGEALKSGAALTKFRQMVVAQGGDPRVIDNPSLLPQAAYRSIIRLPNPRGQWWVKTIDAKEIGLIAKQLAAQSGSEHASAGVVLHAKVGKRLREGDKLATIYGACAEDCESKAARLLQAFHFSEWTVRKPRLVLDVVE